MNLPIKRAFLDTDDGQILYRICGETGDAIILLHRSPRSGDEFTTLMPILAQQRRVIAMDLPGYGESDNPARAYTLEDYAHTVILLLDELGIQTASLLGNHTGAYVAGECAAAYPNRIQHLVMANVDYFSEDEQAALRDYYPKIFRIKDDGSNLAERWAFIHQYATMPELTHRCFIDQLKCFNVPPYGPIAVTDYFHKIDHRFGQIKCPVLMISGTEDMTELERLGLASAEGRDQILKLIPQGKRVDLDGGGFCMMHQMADEIATEVIAFLEA